MLSRASRHFRKLINHNHDKMPEHDVIDDLLGSVVRDYDSHMHKLGCFGTHNNPRPSLQNDILPMFINRWAPSGPNQHTSEIFHAM
jgi:hypothetical protein